MHRDMTSCMHLALTNKLAWLHGPVLTGMQNYFRL